MAHTVLVLNGSPHPNGCTARALEEVIRTLREEGIETVLILGEPAVEHGAMTGRTNGTVLERRRI